MIITQGFGIGGGEVTYNYGVIDVSIEYAQDIDVAVDYENTIDIDIEVVDIEIDVEVAE